jgi:hypothetical protein
MLKFRSKQIVVAATVIILSGFFILSGCQSDEQITPVYVPIESLPLEITIDQIYADYMADETAADDKYKGGRFLFYGVTVEKVNSVINWGNNEVFMYNSHFITGGVKFNPKYTVYLDNVWDGFVVDIVGECKGLIWPINSMEPLLQISDCWINIVEGDSGTTFQEEYY